MTVTPLFHFNSRERTRIIATMSYESMKEMLIDIVSDFGSFGYLYFHRPLPIKKQPRNCNYPPIIGLEVYLVEHNIPQVRAFGWGSVDPDDNHYYEADIRNLSFTDRVRIMRRAFREVEKRIDRDL